MRRFGMTELRERALAAVDEAAEQTKEGPVRRSLALRFALAFLAKLCRGSLAVRQLLAGSRGAR
jgi:hypothetical protein